MKYVFNKTFFLFIDLLPGFIGSRLGHVSLAHVWNLLSGTSGTRLVPALKEAIGRNVLFLLSKCTLRLCRSSSQRHLRLPNIDSCFQSDLAAHPSAKHVRI